MRSHNTTILPAFVLPGSSKTNEHRGEGASFSLHESDAVAGLGPTIKHLQHCDKATIERHIKKLSVIRLGLKVPRWLRNNGRSQTEQGRSEPIRSSIFIVNRGQGIFVSRNNTPYIKQTNKQTSKNSFSKFVSPTTKEICQSSTATFSLKCSCRLICKLKTSEVQ